MPGMGKSARGVAMELSGSGRSSFPLSGSPPAPPNADLPGFSRARPRLDEGALEVSLPESGFEDRQFRMAFLTTGVLSIAAGVGVSGT